MDNVILYIGDSYVDNFFELKDVVSLCNNDDHDVKNEIITLYKDQLLQRWLSNGKEEEQEMAQRLNDIPKETDDSVLLSKIVNILTNEKIHIVRNCKEYFNIHELYYSFDKTSYYRIEDSKVYDIQNQKKLFLKLEVTVLKTANETFDIKLYRDGREVRSAEINTDSQNEGCKINIHFNNISLQDCSNETEFQIFVENEKINSFNFFRM